MGASSQKSLVKLVACGDREDYVSYVCFLPGRRPGKKHTYDTVMTNYLQDRVRLDLYVPWLAVA
jgi:hypothetical protein